MIYEQVAAILSELPAIGKNAKAPSQMGGYAFRSIEDITAALKPLLAKHGVFITPSVLDRADTVRETSKGGVWYCVDLKVRFTFRDLTGDSFDTDVWGQGTDAGDKAVQKAMTSAFKTMLSITFCISDAELDAERHDVPQSAPKVRDVWSPGEASLQTATARCSSLAAIGVDILKERNAVKLPPLRQLRHEADWHAWLGLLDRLEATADAEADEATQ